ncbi:MAG: hypothetical protein L6300_10115 [Syntrophaceae bacterium]|nr:hypothetical protein [Pseudomonadota bacterium]MCG2740575.1 hypothetical protein [Syntrophaceae bacterium]
MYAAMTKDEAQRSIRAFYEAVKVDKTWIGSCGVAPTKKEAASVRDKGVEAIEKSYCIRKAIYSLLIFCFLQPILGCHHRRDEGGPVPEGKIVFDRIAVVPFQQIIPEDLHQGVVRCPLCGMIFIAAKAAGSPEVVIEGRFLEYLKESKPKLNIIAGERVAGAYRRISTASLKGPLRQVLRDVGNELGAEGVVLGYVYRFRERKGESFSVEQPASVAFDIHLIRVEDGALVWRGAFDRTQSSLMEDLLQVSSFYREKGRWVTAEELAAGGLQEVLKSFPGLP